MKNTIRACNMKATMIIVLVLLQMISLSFGQTSKAKSNSLAGPYVCMPCGNDCDKETYDMPGECSICHMKLVARSTITFKNISPEKLCEIMLQKPGTILLDVRTKEEFNGTSEVNYGRLKNAINIPVQELEKRMDELKPFKNKDIIVYCSHSHRSPQASYVLTQNGFSHITNMLGGMSVWDEAVKNKECTAKLLVK